MNAETINGIYDPTDEGLSSPSFWPVYRKRGDPNKWLEFYSQTNKWYVKATTDKGRARGWMRITCDPPSRPEQCKHNRSVPEVWDGSKWIAQDSVTIVTSKQRKEEDRVAGALRLAHAVAVDIRGAVGPSAASINGVYTPTDEICSGWPVYRKEGDPDKWLEYITATNEWYVKPSADRGRPEGWMCLGCEPPAPPELSRGVCEVWDGEMWGIQNNVTVLTAACAFENMLEVQIFCAEETRELQEKLNSMLNVSVNLLTSPRITSSSTSLLSDKSNTVFCQTLQNVLTGTSNSSSSSKNNSAHNHNNSNSNSNSSNNTDNSNVITTTNTNSNSNTSEGRYYNYISAPRIESGKKQLKELMTDLDDRLTFLHEQGDDEDENDVNIQSDSVCLEEKKIKKIKNIPANTNKPTTNFSTSTGKSKSNTNTNTNKSNLPS